MATTRLRPVSATSVTLLLFVVVCFRTSSCDLSISIAEYVNGTLTPSTKIVIDESRDIQIAPNTTYVITCEGGNDDLNNIPWTRDQNDIAMMNVDSAADTESKVFYDNTETTTSELYLWNFDRSLSGSYTCHSTVGNKTLNITENNPAIILGETYFPRKESGSESVSITFFLSGVPKSDSYTLTLYFEGIELDNDLQSSLKLILIISSTSIILQSLEGFRKQNDGVYTGVLTTPAGTSNANFILDVQFRPSIILSSDCNCSTDNMIVINENSNLTLSCVDTNADPPPQFTWFKDGIKDPENLIIENSSVVIEQISESESQLKFFNIRLDNAGKYYCKANNSFSKKNENIIILIPFSPQVSRITSEVVAVPIGQNIQLLVIYSGGFPDPQVSWSHQVGNDFIDVSQDQRASFSGTFELNFTLSEAVVSDGGLYRLTVMNSVETIELEFTVSIQVPPTLTRLSKFQTYHLTESTATFVMNVSDAVPPVMESNLNWQGNYKSNQQTVTFDGERASLELNNLRVTDTGNITLIVNHPAGEISKYFELVVLDAPSPPNIIETTFTATCTLKISWEIESSENHVASTDQVKVEQRLCLYDAQTCDKEWEEVDVYPPSISTCVVPLLPNQDYSFRLTSNNSLVGYGEPFDITIPFSSNVVGFNPQVQRMLVTPLSSTQIQISWSEPTVTNDCYNLKEYSVKCWDTRNNDIHANTTVQSRGLQEFHINVTELTPDSQYNCSVDVIFVDLMGNTATVDISTDYDTGHTYPHPPTTSSPLDISNGDEDERDGTINLNLTSFKESIDSETISHIQIMILRLGNSPTLPSETPDELYNSANSFSTYEEVHSDENDVKISYKPYIAAEYEVGSIPNVFILGADDLEERKRQSDMDYVNGPLVISDYYSAFVRSFSKSQFGKQYSIFLSSSFLSPRQPAVTITEPTKTTSANSGGSSSVVAGVVVILILFVICVVVAVIVAVIILKVRQNKAKSRAIPHNGVYDIPLNNYADPSEVKSNSPDPLPLANSNVAVVNPNYFQDVEEGKVSLSPENSSLETTSVTSSKAVTPCPSTPNLDNGTLSTMPPSEPITKDEFQDHLNNLDANEQEGFENELKWIIKHAPEHPAEASNRAHMHGKNRYKNITAFDRTRVCLEEIEDIPNSDYINANYIKGYDQNKVYIATQGPNEETHCDFWRMIWERKTATIVMLTNLEENGKLKCCQYWPSEGEKAYGDIVVRVDNNIVLPHYTIRSFKLIYAGLQDEERTVLQFHYTTWPDKNVPAQASPVLDFLRAINSANDCPEYGPIVVHCSAGIGRTGTIIALDICLDQLTVEDRIDVRGVVSFLREQRTQMVQVLCQYIFIHHAILEGIVYGDSAVLLKEFPEHYRKLQASECSIISDEFDKIGRVRPPAQASSGPDIVPLSIQCKSEVENFSAHYVDGYWDKKVFIVSSCPAPDNLEHFWQMIWQQQCSHVINLSPRDARLFKYLPESGKEMIIGDLRLTVDNLMYMTGYIARIITITTEGSEPLTIRHMQYQDWLPKHLPRVDKFVKFLSECLREVESSERAGRPILIHDGGTLGPAGVFTTLLYCFQRFGKERLVDLLQAANGLYIQCPGLVHSLQYYAYCYDCLHEYSTKLLKENPEPPIYENIASFRGHLQPSPEPIEKQLPALNEYVIL